MCQKTYWLDLRLLAVRDSPAWMEMVMTSTEGAISIYRRCRKGLPSQWPAFEVSNGPDGFLTTLDRVS